MSEDMGYHWRAISKTFPDHPTFTFRSSHDGEYWFAVQTRTIDGKVSPSLDSTIEPNMKVVGRHVSAVARARAGRAARQPRIGSVGGARMRT